MAQVPEEAWMGRFRFSRPLISPVDSFPEALGIRDRDICNSDREWKGCCVRQYQNVVLGNRPEFKTGFWLPISVRALGRAFQGSKEGPRPGRKRKLMLLL